jgi:hypothetical protein
MIDSYPKQLQTMRHKLRAFDNHPTNHINHNARGQNPQDDARLHFTLSSVFTNDLQPTLGECQSRSHFICYTVCNITKAQISSRNMHRTGTCDTDPSSSTTYTTLEAANRFQRTCLPFILSSLWQKHRRISYD